MENNFDKVEALMQQMQELFSELKDANRKDQSIEDDSEKIQQKINVDVARNRYGVYMLVIADRCYIGKGRLYGRIHHHLSQLKNNRHVNTELQNAYSQYGLANLKYYILYSTEKKDAPEIDIIERLLLDLTKNALFGYNSYGKPFNDEYILGDDFFLKLTPAK